MFQKYMSALKTAKDAVEISLDGGGEDPKSDSPAAKLGRMVGGDALRMALAQRKKQDEAASQSTKVGELQRIFDEYNTKFADKSYKIGQVDYDYSDPDQLITLHTGKFRGARVPKQLVIDATNAAKKAGVDPYDLLALIGQESTFGSGTGEHRRGSKAAYVSANTNREKFQPYQLYRFLADQKVPGISTIKTNHGLQFTPDDPKAIEEYLQKNPAVYESYINKLKNTPELPEDFDDFYETALRMKKGLAKYNPGDPNYVKDVLRSKDLLMHDQNLKAFLSNPVAPSRTTTSTRPGRRRPE